jgi:outer membrane immunogenic protein
MRATLAATAILAVFAASSASAADLPMPTKAPPPPPPPIFSWTGFYIGANGGGGWGHESYGLTQVTPFGLTAGTCSGNSSGGLFGGQIGFNYEFPTHVGPRWDTTNY